MVPDEHRIPPDPAFVGREHELEELRIWTDRDMREAMVVLGPAGVGKTALAQRFVRQIGERIRSVIFCSALETGDIGRLLRHIEERLDASRESKRVLVVIDDLERLRGTQKDWAEFVERVFSHRRFSRDRRESRFYGHVHWLLLGRALPDELRNGRRPLLEEIDYRLLPLSGLDDHELREMMFRIARTSPTPISEREIAVLAPVLQERLQGNPALARMLLKVAFEGGNLLAALKALESRSNLSVVADGKRLAVLPTAELAATAVTAAPGGLWTAVPHLFVPRVAKTWQTQVRQFEALINQATVKEAQLQKFFEDHPHFLRGIDYSRVVAHPVLERIDAQGNLIPDFFLQPINGEFADIWDLKLPTAPLIVGTKDRMRLSAAVMEALAQVREYRDYFEDSSNRQRVHDRYGLTSYRPSVAVVIGTNNLALPPEKRKQIFDGVPKDAKVLTYDELLAKMQKQVDLCAS